MCLLLQAVELASSFVRRGSLCTLVILATRGCTSNQPTLASGRGALALLTRPLHEARCQHAIYLYIHMYARLIFVCIYIYMCIYIYVYIYIYQLTYNLHIYIYITYVYISNHIICSRYNPGGQRRLILSKTCLAHAAWYF